MRQFLGHLSFITAVAFGVGLFLAMSRIAWADKVEINGLLAFLGFGAPMVLSGVVTAGLGAETEPLMKRLGWTCTWASLLWAASLLFLLAGWVGIIPGPRGVEFFSCLFLFMGFALPMILCGGAGLGILVGTLPAQSGKKGRTMLDTIFAVSGRQLRFQGALFTVKEAGIKNELPYAVVDPGNDAVAQAIIKQIRKSMPVPFSLEGVQKDLDNV